VEGGAGAGASNEPSYGVLENRVVCTLLSILGIATSVRSWLWIAKVRHHRDVF